MIKKGLKVLILSGKEKKEGEVIELDRKNRAKVKEINMVKNMKTTKEKKVVFFQKKALFICQI